MAFDPATVDRKRTARVAGWGARSALRILGQERAGGCGGPGHELFASRHRTRPEFARAGIYCSRLVVYRNPGWPRAGVARGKPRFGHTNQAGQARVGSSVGGSFAVK